MPLAKAVSNSEVIMRDNNNRRRDDRNNQPESDIKDRLVTINRSTKTTKGGRTFTFTGIVVVGDEKGKVGHGSGRSREVVTAIQKGIEHLRIEPAAFRLFGCQAPMIPDRFGRGLPVFREPDMAASGGRDGKAAGPRPIH